MTSNVFELQLKKKKLIKYFNNFKDIFVYYH